MIEYAKSGLYLIVVLFLSLLLVYVLCDCSRIGSQKFQKKISHMSDNRLLDYYYGINQRIKDIDDEFRRNERLDNSEYDRFAFQDPFIIGGQGYNLIQKRKLILEELKKRNVIPDPP